MCVNAQEIRQTWLDMSLSIIRLFVYNNEMISLVFVNSNLNRLNEC